MNYTVKDGSTIRVLLNETFLLNSRFRVVLYALEVPISKKFPGGIKAKYVLIDSDGNFPRLLVDNHEPFGFHMHTQLPENNGVRVGLSVEDHNEALDLFFKEAERIAESERK